MTDTVPGREPAYPCDLLFVNRWSPRAMSGEPLTEAELMTLFEAARWAPSCFNNQPWRFLYARREREHWSVFFSLLGEGNQAWCKRAAALIVVISKTTFDHSGKFSPTHSYDTGAAWENLALQGSIMGLVIHGMAGFDHDRARSELEVPEGYTVEAMIAVGRPGDKNDLPEDRRAKEKPSLRKPLSELVCEGPFDF